MNISRTPGVYSYVAPEYNNRPVEGVDRIRSGERRDVFRSPVDLEDLVQRANLQDRMEIRTRPEVKERLEPSRNMNRPEDMARFQDSAQDPAAPSGMIQNENPVRNSRISRIRSQLFRSAGEEATPGLFLDMRA